jgi:hypothetical protein
MGQDVVNNFNYFLNGSPAALFGSVALARALGLTPDPVSSIPSPTSLAGRIREIQSNGLRHEQFTIINMYDPVDFFSSAMGWLGSSIAEGLAPYESYGFISSQTDRSIRASTKRFAGVTEFFSEAGGVLNTNPGGGIDNLRIALGANAEYNDSGTLLAFTPCTLGRQRYDPATKLPDPNGKAYRFFPTYAEQINNYAAATNWRAYNQTRTQTSRQVNVGS